MALTRNNHYLDNTGVETLWGKIESLLQSAVSALQTLINAKQDTLTFDTTPTEDSTNPVTSGGVKSALSSYARLSEITAEAQTRSQADFALNQSVDQLSDRITQVGSSVSTNASNISTNTSNISLLQGTVSGMNTTYSTQITNLWTAVNGKQNTLTFDSTPTENSTNPVTSGGVYTALSAKQDTLTAGTGLSLSGATLNHSNSVAAKTDYLGGESAIPRIKIDAQGHITGYTTIEPNERVRTNGSATSTNVTAYHKLMTVDVPSGYQPEAGVLELFASNASSSMGYYYFRVYFNMRNNASSSSSTCSHVNYSFHVVDHFGTAATNAPTADNFSYGWKNNDGKMSLVFYFKTLGTNNRFTFRFYFDKISTVGTTYANTYVTTRDTDYTYVDCSQPTMVQTLGNYTDSTYTVTNADGIEGMSGTGTLVLPKMTSTYSIGRRFWVAPTGGSIAVTWTKYGDTTASATIASGNGAEFVVTSGGYWARIN